MTDSRSTAAKRPRGQYSRLICTGCRERRIRCELPSGIGIPSPGELRTAETPCYRCKRLRLPCIIRQTILGRANIRAHAAISEQTIDASSPKQACQIPRRVNTLSLHRLQSPEHVFILRALDTLRRERVEEEWFRFLPAYVGHTPALDLSIQALITACAYSRAAPELTSADCYRALGTALDAVRLQIHQQQSCDDDMLAATALLLPFEGVLRYNGIPSRLHMDGLAAILAARPIDFPVSQFAREIVDFHGCEIAMLACLQGTSSPFESIARAYFTKVRIRSEGDEAGQLKALANELFIRIPRLVGLMRAHPTTLLQRKNIPAQVLGLLHALLQLQDSRSEDQILLAVQSQPTKHSYLAPILPQSMHFACVRDFEGLVSYWLTRLILLRLECRFYNFLERNHLEFTVEEHLLSWAPMKQRTQEVIRLVKNILMCLEYSATLPLRKHCRLMLHAIVVVWGVVKDIPGISTLEPEAREIMFAILLSRINESLMAEPGLTFVDVDTAAEVLAGGSQGGRFVDLHRL